MRTAGQCRLPKFSIALALFLLLACAGESPAQNGAGQASEKLNQISRESVPRAEGYLDQIRTRVIGASVPAEMRTDLAAFAEHARKYIGCMKLIRVEDFAFKARFDRELRESMFSAVDQLTACRVDNLLFAPGTRALRCCTTLDEEALTPELKELAKPEFELAADLGRTWSGFERAFAEGTIQEMKRSLKRFERKLIDGFPGMPWEYILNIQGDRSGPSPHQIIWAHFDVGMEHASRTDSGDAKVQPVLGLQVLGYNRYFLDSENWAGERLKYVGFAALVTASGKKGVNAARYGGVFHFGNYISAGATYGDRKWRVYLSSNKAFDQILKIWN
jgi:hypothetical protein